MGVLQISGLSGQSCDEKENLPRIRKGLDARSDRRFL
jgi:hypothetical protein